jgi:hypothetical protein
MSEAKIFESIYRNQCTIIHVIVGLFWCYDEASPYVPSPCDFSINYVCLNNMPLPIDRETAASLRSANGSTPGYDAAFGAGCGLGRTALRTFSIARLVLYL